jgi:hypothetical protein
MPWRHLRVGTLPRRGRSCSAEGTIRRHGGFSPAPLADPNGSRRSTPGGHVSQRPARGTCSPTREESRRTLKVGGLCLCPHAGALNETAAGPRRGRPSIQRRLEVESSGGPSVLSEQTGLPFGIAALAASAGGLNALTRGLGPLPPDFAGADRHRAPSRSSAPEHSCRDPEPAHQALKTGQSTPNGRFRANAPITTYPCGRCVTNSAG